MISRRDLHAAAALIAALNIGVVLARLTVEPGVANATSVSGNTCVLTSCNAACMLTPSYCENPTNEYACCAGNPLTTYYLCVKSGGASCTLKPNYSTVTCIGCAGKPSACAASCAPTPPAGVACDIYECRFP